MMVLAVWAAAAAAVLVLISPNLAAGLGALLVAATLLTTVRAGRGSGLAVAVLGSLAFAFAHLAILVQQLDPESSVLAPAELAVNPLLLRVEVWSPTLIGALILLASVAVGMLVSHSVSAQAQVQSRQQSLIEILSREDPDTELASRQHGMNQAELEVGRARRYRRVVALALIGVDPPPAEVLEPGEGRELMQKLAAATSEGLRQLDTVSRYGAWEVLLVLPETPAAGARTLVTRITLRASERVGRPVRAALMMFPADAPTTERLLAELEAALEVCRSVGLQIGDSSLLQSQAEPIL